MIDPKELRIGNMVQVRLHERKNIYNKSFMVGDVVSIDSSEIVIDVFDDIVTWDCESVDPIPISPEWLERLGFEKDNSCLRLVFPHEVFEVENGFTFWPNEDFTINTSRVSFGAYGRMKIQYIHQVQNLFYALTGSELTIKQPETI